MDKPTSKDVNIATKFDSWSRLYVGINNKAVEITATQWPCTYCGGQVVYSCGDDRLFCEKCTQEASNPPEVDHG